MEEVNVLGSRFRVHFKPGLIHVLAKEFRAFRKPDLL